MSLDQRSTVQSPNRCAAWHRPGGATDIDRGSVQWLNQLWYGPAMRATPWWRRQTVVIVAGCLIAIVTFGTRTSFGLFTEPLSVLRGWDREAFALAIAVQNLLWGVGQPFAGAIADRYGAGRVLAAGGAVYALGTALMAVSSSPATLALTGGVLVGFGLSGGSFMIVIAAFARLVPAERRSWAMGLATAAGSMGQFLFAPLGQAFISAYGAAAALVLLAGSVALVPILAGSLSGRGAAEPDAVETGESTTAALRRALAHPSYVLLASGFFVCGFHIAFISTHLPPYLTDVGLSTSVAAWAIGLLWLSTVPLTSGLIALMFGTRHVGMLFGVVFLSHQVGAFIGVWLGGALYESTGTYDLVWYMAI